MKPQGRVLVIAGSDPSGGAGIQADIKTITALGGYAMTAITALTVQNTCGVSAVELVSTDLIHRQISACLDDIGADAIKIGMIGNADAVVAIADLLRSDAPEIPIILDPVMIATSGDRLADADVKNALIEAFLPDLVRVMTPNISELEALTQHTDITSVEAMKAAGAVLQKLAPDVGLVLKGGHLPGATVSDILIDQGAMHLFTRRKRQTTSTHGTGCTLASAIATGLAQGLSLRGALDRAIAYVDAALGAAPGFGGGAGPLGHTITIRDSWRPGQ